MKLLPFISMALVATILVTKQVPAPPPPPAYLEITEIMYNSPETDDSLNFIELNATGFGNNLADWTFSSGINFQFPDSSVPAGFGNIEILIVQDSVAFENVYGINAFQWDGFSDLSLSTPIILENYWVSDTIEFASNTPYESQANGYGYSLQRCSNNVVPIFQPSTNNTGIQINGLGIYASPGTHQYSPCTTVDLPEIQRTQALRLYPNPNTGTFTLDYGLLQQNATLRIRNTLSQILFERQVKKGSTTLTQNIKFNKGIYLLELDEGNNCQHQYLVVTD